MAPPVGAPAPATSAVEDLPEELLVTILSFLDFSSLLNVRLASRLLSRVAGSGAFFVFVFFGNVFFSCCDCS